MGPNVVLTPLVITFCPTGLDILNATLNGTVSNPVCRYRLRAGDRKVSETPEASSPKAIPVPISAPPPPCVVLPSGRSSLKVASAVTTGRAAALPLPSTS